MKTQNRRSIFKKMFAGFLGITGASVAVNATPNSGVDENGKEILGNKVSGNLCIRKPWPGILRTTWGDHERCKQTYFSTYPGLYFTGDGALRDENGYYRITGRVDDVLNIAGHRLGTAEIESALVLHESVAEAAVVPSGAVPASIASAQPSPSESKSK